MRKAPPAGMVQRRAQVAEGVDEPLEAHAPHQILAEVTALNVLHGQVEPFTVSANSVDMQNVGMAEVRLEGRMPLQFAQRLGRLGHSPARDGQCHPLVGMGLGGQVKFRIP